MFFAENLHMRMGAPYPWGNMQTGILSEKLLRTNRALFELVIRFVF